MTGSARRHPKIGRFLSVAILALVFNLHTLSASSPSASQMPAFHHTSWDNAGLGAVYDVRQDHESYIWLQTATGIFRFDGVKFLSVDQVTGGLIRNASGVDAVLPASGGGVWFMVRGAGLLLWKNDRLLEFHDNRCTGRLREAPDGSLWIAGSSGLYHLKGQRCEAIGKQWGVAPEVPSGLLVDREGTVWLKRWSGNLLFLKPGSTAFEVSPYGGGASKTLSFLHEAPDGSVWLVDGHGLRKVRGEGNAVISPTPEGPDHSNKNMFGDFAFAKDGSIWIVTANGVRWAPYPQRWEEPSEMRAAPGQDFTLKDGMSSDVIWGLLIDREDNVWMATNSGLDQVRRAAFHTVRLPHVQEHQFGIAPGKSGSIWIGSESLPLTYIQGDKQLNYLSVGPITCLKQGRDGIIWAASKANRLWRISGTKFTHISYPHESEQPIIAMATDRENGLWISLRQYGVFRMSRGVWTDENGGIGKAANAIAGITEDETGDVWFSFGRKLVQWNGEHYLPFSLPSQSQGLSGSVLAAAYGHVWLPTKSGLELFIDGVFRPLNFADGAWPGNISGMAETTEGDLWFNGFSGVTHISRYEIARWLLNPEVAISTDHLDALDGLPGLSGEATPKPSLVISREDRAWFATTKGVAWLDRNEFDQSRNRLPPSVVISSISANGTPALLGGKVVFPPRVERLKFTYDALSFAAPKKVFFKYQLEGLDKGWQNAGTSREAFYNSLQPGHYRFRVLACNNDGVWNETGASISFSVRPAYYQTWWFILLVVLATILVIWRTWMLRIRIITQDLQGRLSARLEERERIARELHDTLLQGLFGLSLRLQTSVDQLYEGHPVRADITQALNQSDVMMLKGRQRIQGLRGIHVSDNALSTTLESHGRQLQDISVVQFRLSVEGERRPLNPAIEEELSLIGCEALTNAFRHSRAALIQLEIVYRWSCLEVRISDDGNGIDPAILAAGERRDHWGLPSMRERAKKMHARFRIGPGRSGGTLVEVRVPGAVVYRGSSTNLMWLWYSIFRTRKAARAKQEPDGAA